MTAGADDVAGLVARLNERASQGNPMMGDLLNEAAAAISALCAEVAAYKAVVEAAESVCELGWYADTHAGLTAALAALKAAATVAPA